MVLNHVVACAALARCCCVSSTFEYTSVCAFNVGIHNRLVSTRERIERALVVSLVIYPEVKRAKAKQRAHTDL